MFTILFLTTITLTIFLPSVCALTFSWATNGLDGSRKWLDRVYRLMIETGKLSDENDHSLDRVYHQTVKKVTDDFEKLGFNTAISQMMIFINECYKAEHV